MPPVASNSSGRDPGSSTGRPIQAPLRVEPRERLAAMTAVDDGAETRTGMRRRGDRKHGLGDERLEVRDPRVVGAARRRELLQLAAMVECEDAQVAGLRARRSSRGAGADARVVSGRAGVAARPRNSSSSARVGIAGVQPWRVTTIAPAGIAAPTTVRGRQPSIQPLRYPDRNASPAPRTFNTSTGNPPTTSPCSTLAGIGPSNTTQPATPRFMTMVAPVRARIACRASIALAAAARDANLLFSADDQVEVGQEGLDLPRHLGRAFLAVGAAAVARQAPEHGPVVDVEDELECRAAFASAMARRDAARTESVDRCVPVIASAFAAANGAASTSAGVRPMSAQFSR